MTRNKAASGLAISILLALGASRPGLLVNPAMAVEAKPDTIVVLLDQAKLLKLPTGAETIIVGNPAVADVSVQRNGVLVITGRMAGRTNFIALDVSGTIISESSISVTAPIDNRLIVQRGLERNSYDCAPNCLPTVSLGDAEKHFSATAEQTTARDGLANPNPVNNVKK